MTRNIIQRIMRSYSAIAGRNGGQIIDVNDLLRIIATQESEGDIDAMMRIRTDVGRRVHGHVGRRR